MAGEILVRNANPADPAVQALVGQYGASIQLVGSDLVWIGSGPPPGTTGGGGLGVPQNAGLNVPVGYVYELQARDFEYEQELQRQRLEAERRLREAEIAANERINAANNRFTAQQNELNRQFEEEMRRLDRELQRELEANRISSQEYMQARALAQQESEFARRIALETLIADRNYEIQQAQIELARVAEIRAERLLLAQLEANPTDFVASQFYKRNLGSPEAMDVANQFAAGGPGEAALQGQTQPALEGDQTLIGQNYPAAAPPYSDQTLQTLVDSFYSGGSNQPLYNPNLSGTGAFGVNIQAPNTISRNQAQNFTDAELGVLTSFLNAGVEDPNNPQGRRTRIDPQDYFGSMERSFIPTLSGAGQATRYF